MADLAKYVVRLEAQTAGYKRGLDRANRQLEGFQKRQTSALDKVGKGFLKLAGTVGALVSVTAGLSKTVSIGRQFDILSAQLKTSTGSAEGAAAAFDELADFASKTPFALEQAVNGFVKLVNLGLTPSRRALESYGNTASAMGKDLNQLIEAVADAATSEFERLKEFGIKAKNQGDTIAFTFRGVTTTVANNAEAIEGFLIGIGETDFAGAMQERVNSLDGALSNLGDSFDGLFRQVNENGFGALVESTVRGATEAIEGITRALATYKTEAGDANSINSDMAGAFKSVAGFAFEVAAAIEKLTVRYKALGEAGKSIVLGGAFGSALFGTKSVFTIDKEAAKEIAEIEARLQKALAALNTPPGEDGGDGSDLLAGFKSGGGGAPTFTKQQEDELVAAQAAFADANDSILAALQGRVREEEELLEDSRRAYADANDATVELLSARIVQQAALFEEVKGGLRTEEEAIQESFQRRMKIITDNTEAGSDEQLRLIERLRVQTEEQVEQLKTAGDAMSEFSKRAAQNMQDAFADFLFDPFEDGLDGMLKNFARVIQRMVAELAASQLFTALGGLSGSGGFVGAIGDFFGGARANGGPVAPGKAFLVGERGPEMFVPSSAGQIVPGGGGGTSIQIIDQRGAGAPPVDIQEQMNGLERMIKVTVRGELAGSFSDGSMDKLMGSSGMGVRRRGSR